MFFKGRKWDYNTKLIKMTLYNIIWPLITIWPHINTKWTGPTYSADVHSIHDSSSLLQFWFHPGWSIFSIGFIWGAEKRKQQQVDCCSLDSMRGSPALQQIPFRVAHLLCGHHPGAAKWNQQHVEKFSLNSIRGSPALATDSTQGCSFPLGAPSGGNQWKRQYTVQ